MMYGNYYRVEYAGPGIDEDGKIIHIKNEGWRVYRAVFHTHWRGAPIRGKQSPRWRLTAVFETECAAIDFVEKNRSR